MTRGRRALLALFGRTKARYIAARCRVTPSAVYDWRSGRRTPCARARNALFVNYGIACDSWGK